MPYINIQVSSTIFHMLHIENIYNVFKHQALLSKETLKQKKIAHHSIAFESVQKLRDRIFIVDLQEKKKYGLHRYVPFYIATHPPMLYVQRNNGIQDQIIIFEVESDILNEPGVLFTDGNAANQQLSRYDQQEVLIAPATKGKACQRKYSPNRIPQGKNTNRSNYYADTIFLDQVSWDLIYRRPNVPFIEDKEEYKRLRSAEVLIPDSLPLSKVRAIAVNSRQMVGKINKLIHAYEIEDQISEVTYKPALFLR